MYYIIRQNNETNSIKFFNFENKTETLTEFLHFVLNRICYTDTERRLIFTSLLKDLKNSDITNIKSFEWFGQNREMCHMTWIQDNSTIDISDNFLVGFPEFPLSYNGIKITI